jgi:hypothetical protein
MPPQVVNGGEGLQIWKECANVISKQLWAANKECSSLGFEQTQLLTAKETACY